SIHVRLHALSCLFLLRATATTELYTLSLHDALPISAASRSGKTRVNVVERFAGFAEGYRRQAVAPRVLHQAKRAVIDWHAALLPGGVVPPALLLERALAGELDHGESRLALGRRASVRAAALINGVAAHTVEVDDIFREGIYP